MVVHGFGTILVARCITHLQHVVTCANALYLEAAANKKELEKCDQQPLGEPLYARQRK